MPEQCECGHIFRPDDPIVCPICHKHRSTHNLVLPPIGPPGWPDCCGEIMHLIESYTDPLYGTVKVFRCLKCHKDKRVY
jgi:hypothetical protein